MSIIACDEGFHVGQKKIILKAWSRWLQKVTKHLDLTTFDHYQMGLNKRRPFFIFILLGLMSISVSAQVTFESKEELLKAANEFFDGGQYAKAKPLFSQLLSQDAVDPNYNYRFGVCMLFTEDDPVKPLPFIEGGANSPGVLAEAFYYLGKAYHLNFRFDEAIEAFQTAKTKSVKINGVDIDKEIQACRNGKVLYNPDLKFEPISDKEAIESEFFRPYNFRKLKGKVIPTPPNFKTKYDEKHLTGAFVYTPTNTQVLFYASYGEDGATGTDIYRVRRLPTGDWALPTKLPGQINTELDEDHAFFDEVTGTLYFSSNGHNSMGGLDIFSSEYNESKNAWSAPVNLQYPYNSPFDDFLYINDPDNTVAFFTSRRASELGKVRVFQNSLEEQNIPELSIITGHYSEASDSTATKMKARLAGNDGLVGEYRSNEKGNYVIVAPPRQGYKLAIAPRDKEAFEFDLNLPKHYKFKPLKQESQFRTDQLGGELALTNYFNSEGEEDSLQTVRRKTSGELPELVASVKASESLKKDDQVLAAVEKAKEDARNEIKEIEDRVREQAVKDSLAEVAQLELAQAKEAETKAEKEREQARADSIRSIEVAELALEEKRKKEEEAKQAEVERKLAEERAEQARLDSLRDAEEKAAELALQQERAANEERQARLRDSLKTAQLASEEEARKQLEMELAAKEKQREDSLARERESATLVALEKARLDSIAAEVEQLKLAALEQAKRNEEELAREPLSEQQAAELAAETEHLEAEEAVAIAKEKAKAESEETTSSEVENAQIAAEGEVPAQIEASVIKEMIENEAQANKELDELNQEKAERTAELSGDTANDISKDSQIAELNQQIEELEKKKAIQDVEKQIALLEERMAAQKEKEQLANVEKERLRTLKENEKEKELALELAKDEERDLLDQIKQIETEQKGIEDSEETILEASIEKQTEPEPQVVKVEEKQMTGSDPEPGEYVADSIEEVEVLEEVAQAEPKIVEPEETEVELVEPVEIINEGVNLEATTEEQSIAEEDEVVGNENAQTEGPKKTEDNTEIASTEIAESSEPTILEEDMSDADLFLETLQKLESDLAKKPSVEEEPQVAEEETRPNEVAAIVDSPAEEKELIVENDPEVEQDTEVSSDEVDVVIEESERSEPEAPAEIAKNENSETVSQPQPNESSETGSVAEIAVESEPETESVEVVETMVELGDPDAEEVVTEIVEQPAPEVEEVLAETDDQIVTETVDADRLALIEHQKKAAQKEAELKEKFDADKAALGISGSNRQTETPEDKTASNEIEIAQELMESKAKNAEIADNSEPAQAETVKPEKPKSAADEFLDAIKQLEEGQKSTEVIAVVQEPEQVIELQPTVSEEKAAVELEEPVVAQSIEPAIDQEEPVLEQEEPVLQTEAVSSEQKSNVEAISIEKTEEIEGDFHPSASRVFKIRPALRDYSLRIFDPNTVEDRKTRRLLQRMNAEDRGRLAVLKSIHNAAIDAGGDEKTLASIANNVRNKEVLSSRTRVAREAIDPTTAFNWSDRGKRSGVTYRLSFKFEHLPISNRIRENMDPASEAVFQNPQVKLETGRYFTLADARSAQLEYRSRGMGKPMVQAYYNSDPIELLGAIARPVVE